MRSNDAQLNLKNLGKVNISNLDLQYFHVLHKHGASISNSKEVDLEKYLNISYV